MDDPFARARILLEQNRFDLAEREIRARLGDAPNDPEGYILLSLCLAEQKKPECLDAAKRALELAPNLGHAHLAMSHAHLLRNDYAAAEESIRRVIELEPWQAGYFGTLAAAKLGQYDWREALAAADAGLELDPDDHACLNNRAAALTKLGRHDEAAKTLVGSLEKNPENAHSHANRGWSLLHENDPRKAVVHFREALRLEPDSAWAREGMLEALRAPNWFYRRVLQFFLWLSRFSPRVQFGLMIGFYLLVQLLNGLRKSLPSLEPLFDIIIFAYLAFAAATWYATHAMNVTLMTSRDGRMLLTPTQKWVSSVCTLLLLVVLGLAAYGLLASDFVIVPAAIYVFLLGVHVSSVAALPAGKYRWRGLAASLVIFAIGAHVTVEQTRQAVQLQAVLVALERLEADFRVLPPAEARTSQNIWIDRQLATLTAQLSELKARRADLEAERNLFVFGGLATLFLHQFLAVKARREMFAME